MNAITLAGLGGAALLGLGLFGLVTHPHLLRKILAFNVMGGGVFLLFGAIARRGAAAGVGADSAASLRPPSSPSASAAFRSWDCRRAAGLPRNGCC